MIRELLYEIHSLIREFAGNGSVTVLFAVSALLLLMLCAKKKSKNGWAAMSPLGVIALAVPEVLERVRDKVRGGRLTRYAAVTFAALVMVLAVTSSGRMVVSGDHTEKAENDMHIPSYLTEAMSTLLREEGEPKVLVPYEWSPYFSAYSSRFVLPDGILDGSDENAIRSELDIIHPDMKKISNIAHRNGFVYVLLPADIWPEVPITKCGYELVLDYGGCSLYREVRDP